MQTQKAKTIDISIDVYARLWALREDGENNESDILRRVLGLHNPTPAIAKPDGSYYAKRYNVRFPEGFRVHRTFKGRDYAAVVHNRQWKLEHNGKQVQTITALSHAIGTGVENAWQGWRYTDARGVEHSISNLRDPATVRSRT